MLPQRICNQLPFGLDTALSQKGPGWTWRGTVERVDGANRRAIRVSGIGS